MAYGTVNADVISTSVANTSLGAGNASIMKNRIINGAMVIDQRNAGASVTVNSASNFYSVDRFFGTGQVTDGVFTLQQTTTAPSGFINSLLATITTADTSLGATQQYLIGQAIEGLNITDLGWGTADAKTVTLSFWVRSSLTGTFGGSIVNSGFNRSYPFSYTISSANTWEQKSITIAGDTTGTWLTTNGVGIRVYWSLGAGSTYSGTAGSWSGSYLASATGATSVVGTNGATFYITGVQLEVGSSATGFEYRQYTNELQLCQRYYAVSYAYQNTYITSSGYAGVPVGMPVTQRASATVTTIANNNANLGATSYFSTSPYLSIIGAYAPGAAIGAATLNSTFSASAEL